MKFIEIGSKNIDKLHIFFFNNEIPPSFRYFNSRGFQVVKNHVVTVLLEDDKKIIAYGHIDKEVVFGNQIYWVGICVLPNYHRKGYGTKMMEFLLEKALQNKLPELFLSVDLNNVGAIKLYENFNFTSKIELKEKGIQIMHKSLK